jgi:hypothetical protein
MEKIYTIDDIYEIYKIEITEVNKIKCQKLLNFEEDELLKQRKINFYKKLLEIKKINLEITNVFKTKLGVVRQWTYDISSKERIGFRVINDDSPDLDLFLVSYNSEKIKDLCCRNQYYLPEPRFESFYFNNPKFKVGQKILFDVKYFSKGYEDIYLTSYGGQGITYYNNIDEHFLSKNNINCFIVTTTMGDINHPVVVDFRKYRDEILLNNYFGRVFINIYYRIGPVLSKVIKSNSFLFTISKKLVLRLHKWVR